MARDSRDEPDLAGYDAFLSYSRRDADFARKIEKALEDFRPPKGLKAPPRRLNIFRDEGDLTGAEYFQAIEGHLRKSSKLIVACSPAARNSEYVNDEIRRYARLKGPQNIVSVLLDGLPNNEAGPGQEGLKAFPEALCEVMPMPLAADYRGFAGKNKVNKGAYESSWYTVLANLLDVSRLEIEERDRKRRQRRRHIAASVAAAVIAALASLTVWALLAEQEAERQRDIAVARQLAAQSVSTRNESVEARTRSGLLAIEAMKRLDRLGIRSLEADQALLGAMGLFLSKAGEFDLGAHAGAVAFSPDGEELLAATRYDHRVRRWRLPGGPLLGESGRNDRVARVARLAPGGRFLVTGSYEDRRFLLAEVWDARSGEGLGDALYSEPQPPPAVSPDGRLVAVAERVPAKTVIVGVATRRKIAELPAARGFAFSPDGKHFALAAVRSGESGLWRLRNSGERWEVERLQTFNSQWVRAVAFSPGGQRLAAGSERDGAVRVWDVAEWDFLNSAKWASSSKLLALSPGGRYIAADEAYHVAVTDLHSGSRAAIGFRGELRSLAFDPRGRYLAVGGLQRQVELWRVGSVGEGASIQSAGRVLGAAFHSESESITVLSGGAPESEGLGKRLKPRFAVYDAASGKLRREHNFKRDLFEHAFSAGGNALAVYYANRTLEVWNTLTGERKHRLPGGEGLTLIALDGPGSHLALADGEKIRVVNLASGKEAASTAYSGELTEIVLGDERWLAASTEKTVVNAGTRGERTESVARIYDLRSGQEVESVVLGAPVIGVRLTAAGHVAKTLAGGGVQVEEPSGTTAAFQGRFSTAGADGNFLATESDNGVIRVWDLSGKSEVARINYRGAASVFPARAVLSADARYVAVINRADEVKVWLLRPADLIQQACEAQPGAALSEQEWRRFLPDEQPRSTCP